MMRYTLQETNIAMENGSCIESLPVKMEMFDTYVC